MAHECPDCGCVCHCNGDIDDLLLNCDGDVNACVCCSDKLDDGDVSYDVSYDDEDAAEEEYGSQTAHPPTAQACQPEEPASAHT
jgi:hypothetical protein